MHIKKRYKLSEEKTFESLFFREKESLLNIVDHFQNNDDQCWSGRKGRGQEAWAEQRIVPKGSGR